MLLHTLIKALILLLSTTYCCTKPNVLIFIVDDLGIGDIGCYGNNTISTPNIDRLCNEGIRLDHNLAAESVCTPSRAALLTGRYAARIGYTASDSSESRVTLYTSASGGLPPNEETFAKVLKSQNYTNGYFGKWHLGIHCVFHDFCHFPLKHGFDYYFGMPGTNLLDCGADGSELSQVKLSIFSNKKKYFMFLFYVILLVMSFSFPYKKHLLFLVSFYMTLWTIDVISADIYQRLNCILMRNYDVIEQPVVLDSVTSRLTNEVVKFVKQNREKPFMAVVAYTKVHTALATAKEFEGKSKHGKYGDSVEEVDWSVGKIINAIDDLRLDNNTFVYFTSDHGPALYMTVNGEMHGGWKGIFKGGKGSSWEGGIRVPTVARWPGVIPSGQVYNRPTSALDLFPTILTFVGENHTRAQVIDGEDISYIFKGGIQRDTRILFHYCGTRLQAVTYSPSVKEVWKLHFEVQRWDNGTENCHLGVCPCFGQDVIVLTKLLLYNLLADPGEKHH